MISGVLSTRENNSFSLSCYGKMIIENGVINHISYKGMPRLLGDSWTRFYQRKKVGDTITQEEIDTILSYNGHYNVVSTFFNKGV